MLACAAASITSVNNLYGRPTIYTDKLGLEILSTIAPDADYIDCYSDLYKNLSYRLWSYAKILTYSKQTQPYFHFDLDFICLQHFGDKFNCDVLFQNFENIKQHYDILKKFYNFDTRGHLYNAPDAFDKHDINSFLVPNLGCVYIKNMEFNKLYTDTAIQLVENNIELFNDKSTALHICVIEQQTLGLLLADNPEITARPLLEDSLDIRPHSEEFIHFIGGWKKDSKEILVKLHQKYFGQFKTNKVLEYASILDNNYNKYVNRSQS